MIGKLALLTVVLLALPTPARGSPADLHLDLRLRDGTRLVGIGPDVSLGLSTALGRLEPKLSAIARIDLRDDRETVTCRSVDGDVVHGVLDGPNLQIRPYGEGEARAFRPGDIVSLRVTRPIRIAGSEGVRWRIDHESSLGWDARSHDGRLEVWGIEPAVVNGGSGGTWARVKLTRSFRPLDDFSAVAEASWDDAGAGSLAMVNVHVLLLDETGREVVFTGLNDSWSTATGGRWCRIAGEGADTRYGTEPATGRARIEISRRDACVEVLWNGEPLAAGKSGEPVASVEVRLEYYAYRGAGIESAFGTVTLERLEIR